jgi:hypothetical protein
MRWSNVSAAAAVGQSDPVWNNLRLVPYDATASFVHDRFFDKIGVPVLPNDLNQSTSGPTRFQGRIR